MVERLTSTALASAAMDDPGLACIAAMSLRSAVRASTEWAGPLPACGVVSWRCDRWRIPVRAVGRIMAIGFGRRKPARDLVEHGGRQRQQCAHGGV